MFGYVKPFKPQLKICEYDIYQAVYCGLCKALKKNYGSMASMTLSYDFAFLALFEYAMNDKEFEILPQKCAAHPFKKKPCLKSLDGLDFTSAAATILVHHKLLDDVSDKKFFKKIGSKFMLSFTKKGYKKAEKLYPELAEYISEQMKHQAALEAQNCKSVDRASEPTANILGKIMSYLSEDESRKTILNRTGYLLGRYIYIVDAFDDVLDDFSKNGYNPLIIGSPYINDLDFAAVQKKAEDSVNFTLGALADAYVELEFERFKPILDNVIYMGLKRCFYDIIERKKEKLAED